MVSGGCSGRVGSEVPSERSFCLLPIPGRKGVAVSIGCPQSGEGSCGEMLWMGGRDKENRGEREKKTEKSEVKRKAQERNKGVAHALLLGWAPGTNRHCLGTSGSPVRDTTLPSQAFNQHFPPSEGPATPPSTTPVGLSMYATLMSRLGCLGSPMPCPAPTL